MIPYFIFLLLSLIIGKQAFRKKQVSNNWLILLFLLMTLFAGLRSSDVGTDTYTYAVGFEDRWFKEMSTNYKFSLTNDFGFYYLQSYISEYSGKYAVLLLTIAAIFSLCSLWSIKCVSDNPFVSLFFFITLGYYTFGFNGARQAIAISIYAISFQYLIKKKFLRYVGFVLAAAAFHHSVLVAIPLYFVFTRNFSKKNVAILALSGLAIGYSFPFLLSIGSSYDSKLAGYEGLTATGGYLLSAFYVSLTVFFVYQRRIISKELLYKYDIFLNMMIIASIIYLVVSLFRLYVEFVRFSAYFQMASIFLWAIISESRKNVFSKTIYNGILIGHIVYYFLFLSIMANLVPYKFNIEYINGLFQ